MALPGLLIEYLVVGSMALLWLLPIAIAGPTVDISFGKAAALAPALYVLGMFVDFIAYIVLSRIPTRKYSLKSFARWLVRLKPDIKSIDNNAFKEGYGRSSRGIIWLTLNAPVLIKEVQARSSRDRIARGAFINIAISWALVWSGKLDSFTPFQRLEDFHWLILIIFSLVGWMFFEANSYGFELRAGEMVPDNDK